MLSAPRTVLLLTLCLTIALLLPSGRAEADQAKSPSRTTVHLLTSLANAGRADAQFSLAQLYFNGNGVDQDYASALEWFTRAAQQNHAEALNSLGMMYADGIGVPPDCPRARAYFSDIPADSDVYAQAQARLAWLLATCPRAEHRDGKQAVTISLNLLQALGQDNPSLLDTLAAAYAETGQFQLAADTQQQAIAHLSDDATDAARRDRFQQRLAFYLASKPWRQTGNRH